MQKDKILTLLRINGIADGASDKDIKAVLTDARYTNDEIESALFLLKQKGEEVEIRTDGLQKVFYTDKHLAPSEVSGLLGVNIDVSDVFQPKKILTRELSLQQMVTIIVVASLLGVIGVAYFMFTNNIGIFHPTAVAFTGKF